jgi:hypothetical protein
MWFIYWGVSQELFAQAGLKPTSSGSQLELQLGMSH